ncbi:MAG: bifunctional DNA-formamidopyrimidine glycosylase/DNA-(apurinic or apyrimidinic site) lyase [bacterium]|nr:bifunctional DNA-formamidopyrimidine glycosylase/DNA-(apurinic or apyrimidinic site) lyase [bacterium]
MPELPEVEVTRRCIAPFLVGRRIAEVRTTSNSYFFLTRPEQLRRGLTGRTVVRLVRRGKYLVAELDDHQRLLLHLGMTGQLFADGASSVRLMSATARAALSPEEQMQFQPDRHTHVQIGFDDAGQRVFFRDVRKFGKIRLLKPDQSDPRLDKLGVDALEASSEHLYEGTRGRKLAIKTLLLSQSIVAGIGNIYADEALFGAGIRPSKRAGRLTRPDCQRILEAAKAVMLRSIEMGGSSISDFVAPDGSDGAYQDERHVYARTGEPCTVCDTPIKRSVLGARASHFCPSCQH